MLRAHVAQVVRLAENKAAYINAMNSTGVNTQIYIYIWPYAKREKEKERESAMFSCGTLCVRMHTPTHIPCCPVAWYAAATASGRAGVSRRGAEFAAYSGDQFKAIGRERGGPSRGS